MAERFSREATQQLNPVIAQSDQLITPNVSATQKLFQSLVAGLQGEAGNSVNAITADANARGVGREALAGDVTAGLQPGLQVGMTGLGAQQGEQLGNLRMAGGRLQADKATLVQQLSQSLQDADISNQQFELDKVSQDRAQALAIRKAEMQAAERAAARASASASDAVGIIEGRLQQLVGGDGKVSPDSYLDALGDWTDAGGDPNVFHSKFDKFVNKAYVDDYYRPTRNVITGKQLRKESIPSTNGKTITGRF